MKLTKASEEIKERILTSKHITLDIETLGRTPDSAITQIAAVEFNPITGDVIEEKEWLISWQSLRQFDIRPGYDSLYWWMTKPDQSARDRIFGEEAQSKAKNIKLVFRELQQWLQSKDDYQVWCHANFDAPVITMNAYKIGMNASPIYYRKVRDIRALSYLTPDCYRETKDSMDFVLHDALDDCRFQAKWISNMLKYFL